MMDPKFNPGMFHGVQLREHWAMPEDKILHIKDEIFISPNIMYRTLIALFDITEGTKACCGIAMNRVMNHINNKYPSK